MKIFNFQNSPPRRIHGLRPSEAKTFTSDSIFKEKISGFTLLEMVVALGIFSILVVLATGAMLGISRAQVNASNNQVLIDNIRFSLELMTKEMRTGTNFVLQDGKDGRPDPVCKGDGATVEIHFTASQRAKPNRVYLLIGNKIWRAEESIDNPDDCDPAKKKVAQFTSSDVQVEEMNITMRGNQTGATDGQPSITITLRVSTTDLKSGQKTFMDLQTTIIQRQRDI